MLQRRRKFLRLSEEDIDPMGGVANLIDVMLVFATGLMVALVMSWNLHNVLFSKALPQERQKLLQEIQRVVEIRQGKELKEVPQIETSCGTGYQEIGTVYRDPKTGKLIMIQNNSPGGK